MAFNPFLLSCFVVSRIGDWFLLDEMGWEFDGFMMDAFSFLFLLMFFCSSFVLSFLHGMICLMTFNDGPSAEEEKGVTGKKCRLVAS
jgi:hypothetical protein